MALQAAAAAIAIPPFEPDPARMRILAERYVTALQNLHVEQPRLTALRREKQAYGNFLLANVPHADIVANKHTQGNQTWRLVCMSDKKPATQTIILDRLIRHGFTEAEISIIRTSYGLTPSIQRVITSIDMINDHDDLEVAAIPIHSIGHALYAYRKADYETHQQQTVVTQLRRIMRLTEHEILKYQATTEFEEVVGDVHVSIGARYKDAGVNDIQAHLLENGLSEAKTALYMAIRRRPVWHRTINSVCLRIGNVEQPPHVFGVFNLEDEE